MNNRLQSGVNGSLSSKMYTIPSLAGLIILSLAGFTPLAVRGAEEGVALAIIYDTSGSMKDPVPDASGGSSPKYVIANRALLAATKQLQAFATNSTGGAPRTLHTGLYIFQGEHARPVLKLGPFDPVALNNWAEHFSNPNGNTPLGNALTTATRAVLDSPLSRKHVLVITDGINTVGPPPAVVLPRLQRQAEQDHQTFSAHFVAFDVDARQFAPLKKLGATVVAAADEKQLNTQLEFILQRKILLEDEEPPKTK